MSGPVNNLKLGWEKIRKSLVIDDPTPTGKFLGCHHKITEELLPENARTILHTCAKRTIEEDEVTDGNVMDDVNEAEKSSFHDRIQNTARPDYTRLGKKGKQECAERKKMELDMLDFDGDDEDGFSTSYPRSFAAAAKVKRGGKPGKGKNAPKAVQK
jgi:hypothetical protein